MNDKTRVVKDIFWVLALAGLVAAIFRLFFGLGATTNLDDSVPWGLWKVFNMIAGVALSTSGFTIGFLVYVLCLKRFKVYIKPAIMIAFLGYGCSCLALLFDIGIPYRFWHPIFMWNINSFLFEVFWCVMLYFTVTTIELAPTVFDRFNANKLSRIFHSVAFVVVIFGISLSSLHHSSLGSLFLVSPQRLHALWYSPRLPLFFIISAMSAGIFFIVFVKIIWSRLYNPEPVFGSADESPTRELNTLEGVVCGMPPRRSPGPEMTNLSLLSLIGAGLLSIYLILKVADLFILQHISEILAGSVESWLYIFELGIGVVLPIIIIVNPKTRKRPVPVAMAGLFASLGLIFNRLNVGIFGYSNDAGHVYFPSLSEWVLGIGVIAAAGLAFMAATEYFPIFGKHPAQSLLTNIFLGSFHSLRQTWHNILSDSLHRVSLLGVFVIPVAFIFMYPPYDSDNSKLVISSIGNDAQRSILTIDGNHSGYSTLFNHADHQKRLGDTASCIQCHHIALPGDYSTPCSNCHRHMYDSTNIFNHENHKSLVAVNKNLQGPCPSNQSCSECHTTDYPKTLQSSKDCLECHNQNMFLTGKSDISLNSMYAVSFTDAMHITCIRCHSYEATRLANDDLDKCYTCHKSLNKDRDISRGKLTIASQSEN